MNRLNVILVTNKAIERHDYSWKHQRWDFPEKYVIVYGKTSRILYHFRVLLSRSFSTQDERLRKSHVCISRNLVH